MFKVCVSAPKSRAGGAREGKADGGSCGRGGDMRAIPNSRQGSTKGADGAPRKSCEQECVTHCLQGGSDVSPERDPGHQFLGLSNPQFLRLRATSRSMEDSGPAKGTPEHPLLTDSAGGTSGGAPAPGKGTHTAAPLGARVLPMWL